jgi:hypothetical protein
MSEGLVSALLARIEEIEKQVLVISAGRFVEGMAGRQVDPEVRRYLDTIADPDAVLRLCRAHRDIIEMHQHAQWVSTRLRERDCHVGLRVVQQRAVNELERVLHTLARGLGVEEPVS